MVATVQVLGWKSEGLRCPDHDISCVGSSGQPHTVTLIQMPNGTGKTTTLTLLRLALSGRWARQAPSTAELRKLQKKGGASKGLFELRLMMNQQRVTIRMEFDFEAGRVRYRTTRGSGRVDRFDPPTEFRRFLNENFVDFFVFDGELAAHLLDDKHTDADSVVETLFQLRTLQNAGERVSNYWERRAEEKGDERLKRTRQNKLGRIRERLDELKRERRRITKEHEEAVAKLEAQRIAYNEEIAKGQNSEREIQDAEGKLTAAQEEVREQASTVLDSMRVPHKLSARFADAIYELKRNLDRAKLPGTAAREFFQDLANEERCVCGTVIDEDLREKIKERAANYLGSDEVGFLNAMKTDIDEAVGTSREAPSAELRSEMTELNTKVSTERDAQNVLDALRVAAERADPAVKAAKEEIDRLETLISKLDDELEKFDDKDTQQTVENTWGIEVMEKRLTVAEEKLARASETLELRRRRDVLTRVLANAHRLAREGVMMEVCAEANEKISELMPDNDIRIERIEHCLVLEGQEGGSVGETLSVAYGFLATLFNRSDHKLPFVVDSPAGPIDLAVRPKIGELVPKLTSQFVAFTISSERAQFVPWLKRASAEPIQYVTVFRRGKADLEAQARATAEVVETVDGVQVTGEAFFNSFQLETEEAA
jgi:DNA sulfur modification protein DndD